MTRMGLDGPSRTIVVEPLEDAPPAPEPAVPERDSEPTPAPEREPEKVPA